MLSTKRLVVIGMVFLGFLLLWYGYDSGSVPFALLPIAPPVYLFLLWVGETKFIAFPLFLYALGLVVLFAWLKKRPIGKQLMIGVVGILAAIHLITFQLTRRAFSQLGSGIVEQMLNRK